MFSLARATTLLVPLVFLTGIAVAQERKAHDAIYDTDADAGKDIAAALAKARYDNKRVLLVYGGNWCGWCRKMHETFKDRNVRRTMLYEYELVTVDIGKWDKNEDIAKKYGSTIRTDGVPYLTVLSGDGKTVAHTGTKPLRTGSEVDASKVRAFLEKHKAEPLDAAGVLASARAKARQEHKLLFIHLGAPW